MIGFATCLMEFTEWGCVTKFRDGAILNSIPHDTPHYYVIAHRCGYGDDILRYCQEHDLAHLVFTEHFNHRTVLWDVAKGNKPDRIMAIFEELSAQSLQRYARCNEEPIVSDVDWSIVRDRFLFLAGFYPWKRD